MKHDPLADSPQPYARAGGAMYVAVIILGVIAEVVVRGKLIVVGDAVTSAQNIVAHDALYRWGFAAELIESVLCIPLAMIFYELFKIVNRQIALMVLFFSLVGTAIGAANLLYHLAPLKILGGADYLKAIPIEQLQAQAHLSLRLFELGFAISLVFFAFFCVLQGYLIIKSTFMPKVVGVLLMVQGICYFGNSFINFLAPQYGDIAFMILALSVVGELSLSLWLLIKGVNVEKWRAVAAQSA